MSINSKILFVICSLFALILSSTANASYFFIKFEKCWVDYSTLNDTCQNRFKLNAGGKELEEGEATVSNTNTVRAAVSLGSGHYFKAQNFSLFCGENKAVSNPIKITVEGGVMRNTVGAEIKCAKRSTGTEDGSTGSDEPEIPDHTCDKKRCSKKVRWADDRSGGRGGR